MIICFCSKSGVGKSSIMNELNKDNNITQILLSKSTRFPRDEFDLTTHTFVSNDIYEKEKTDGQIYLDYISKEHTHNYITYDMLNDTNKILLYAVDIDRAIKLSQEKENVKIVYLYCDENERLNRLKIRDTNIDKYRDEKHLELSMECYIKHTDKISIIDTTNKNIEEVAQEVIDLCNLDLEFFQLHNINNKYIINLFKNTLFIEHINDYEINLQLLLDNILIEYNYMGFARGDDYENFYIIYKNKYYTFTTFSKNKDMYFYKHLIETLLRWKSGVIYDRINK